MSDDEMAEGPEQRPTLPSKVALAIVAIAALGIAAYLGHAIPPSKATLEQEVYDPVSVCGSSSNQKKFIDLFYDEVRHEYNRRVADNPYDGFGLTAEGLIHIEDSGLLKIPMVTLAHYDPNTKNMTCEATIKFEPSAEYRTDPVMEMAENLSGAENVPLPAGLFAGIAASVAVQFDMPINASTGQRDMILGDGSESVTQVIFYIASAKAVVDRRAAR